MLRSKDAAIHDRAEKLFGGPPNHDRQQVIDRYRAALAKLKGDATRGAEVFDKNCAACHRHSPREMISEFRLEDERRLQLKVLQVCEFLHDLLRKESRFPEREHRGEYTSLADCCNEES